MILHDAQVLAVLLRNELSPHCRKIEITGAAGREDPDPLSVEIIVVPLPGHPVPSFGQKHPIFINYLEQALWELEQDGKLVRADKAGEKLHMYHFDPSKWEVNLGPVTLVPFLLYITTMDEWDHMLAFSNAPPPRNAKGRKK